MLEGKYVKLPPSLKKHFLYHKRTRMRGIIFVSGLPSALKNNLGLTILHRMVNLLIDKILGIGLNRKYTSRHPLQWSAGIHLKQAKMDAR